MLKINNKNAQIGIFVIVGVILLIVSIFLFSQSKVDLFSTTQTKQTNQFVEIVNYCVDSSAKQGLFLLGFQGGYIEIPEHISANPTRNIDLGLQIPNWDTQRGEIPTIPFMQNQLNQYVQDNVQGCLISNFISLENQYDISYDFSNLKINSQINQENVQIEVDFPIEFKSINANERYSVSDFFINLENIRLGNLYELALEIYNLELRTNLFEELTLDQIYSASDYSSPLSMPSEGMSFTCSKRIWTKDQLKRNLANLNNNNFKYLYFEGTYFNDLVFNANLNEELGTSNLRQYYDNQYRFNLQNSQRSFSNYKVNVIMPSVEITAQEGYLQRYPFREFDVTPSSGQLIKPISMSVDVGAKIPIPCIQIYHHLYTLDYDLIVTLEDMNSDGNGYFFQFPIRVQVDENVPKKKAFSYVSTQFDELTATSDSYCQADQMLYPVDIYVEDVKSGELLSQVNISYNCISLTCDDMGQTVRPFFRGVERQFAVPKYEGLFPFCIGGQVIAQKEGFHQLPNKEFLETTSELLQRDITLQYDVEMVSIKEFDITRETFLAVFKETREGFRVLDEEDGRFFITIENKNLNFYSEAMWPNNGEFLNKIELLELDNTKYNISIIFVDKDSNLKGLFEVENKVLNSNQGDTLQVIIPASQVTIEEDLFLEFYEYMEIMTSNPDYGVIIK